MRVQYNAQLPFLNLWEGENSWTILSGTVLSTLHGHVICKKWHMCGMCWEDYKPKNLHVPPPPPELLIDIAGLVKTARGNWHERLLPSGGRSFYPQKYQLKLRFNNTGKFSQLSDWTQKRQITGKNIMPLKSIIDNRVAPVKGCLHPASNPSPATPVSQF